MSHDPLHRVIEPDLADRIIASILMNGDTVADVIVIASQVAQADRKPVNTEDIVRELRVLGHTVNDDGTVEYAEEGQ